MKCVLFGAMTFGIKFVRYPALITYLCHMHLITTFKILCIEYRPISNIGIFLLPNIVIGIGPKDSRIGWAVLKTQQNYDFDKDHFTFQYIMTCSLLMIKICNDYLLDCNHYFANDISVNLGKPSHRQILIFQWENFGWNKLPLQKCNCLNIPYLQKFHIWKQILGQPHLSINKYS